MLYSLFVFLLTDLRQNTAQTSEHADRFNDHTLARQEGKRCHSVRVLKNTVQGWHSFIKYAALKELSSFHIKKNRSAETLPVDFAFFLMGRTGWQSSFLKLLQTKHPVSVFHTLSQALELSQLSDQGRRSQLQYLNIYFFMYI